jgi:hypothetical protein
VYLLPASVPRYCPRLPVPLEQTFQQPSQEEKNHLRVWFRKENGTRIIRIWLMFADFFKKTPCKPVQPVKSAFYFSKFAKCLAVREKLQVGICQIQ